MTITDLAIPIRPFIAHKHFEIIWLSNRSVLRVHKGYSRKASCALIWYLCYYYYYYYYYHYYHYYYYYYYYYCTHIVYTDAMFEQEQITTIKVHYDLLHTFYTVNVLIQERAIMRVVIYLLSVLYSVLNVSSIKDCE